MPRLLLALGLLLVLLAGGFFVFAPGIAERGMNVVEPERAIRVSERAQRLHRRLVVADLHSDLLLWKRDPLRRAGRGHTDLPRLRQGNVALQVFSAVTKTPRGQNYQRNTADSDNITLLAVGQLWPVRTWGSLRERALYQAARLHDAAARSDGGLVVVRTAADLDRLLERRAGGEPVVGGLLALEGLQPIEGRLENLDTLFRAGYRMGGLVHFFDNEVAGSAHGAEQGGLTPMGRAAVRRMEQLGMLVDLAHASPRTVDEVLAMATRPVVVSHTGVQATCPGPRNLTDAQIRRIAANGGVIGVGFWPGAVCDASPPAIARAARHVADLVGVRHVALGSDFDGTVTTAFDAAGIAQVTQALLDAGFDEDQVAAVMGGNVMRVLGEGLPREN